MSYTTPNTTCQSFLMWGPLLDLLAFPDPPRFLLPPFCLSCHPLLLLMHQMHLAVAGLTDNLAALPQTARPPASDICNTTTAPKIHGIFSMCPHPWNC